MQRVKTAVYGVVFNPNPGTSFPKIFSANQECKKVDFFECIPYNGVTDKASASPDETSDGSDSSVK